MLLPVLIVFGFVSAALLVFAAVTVARIAVADEPLLVGALGFSGICSLIFTVGYFIRWAAPIGWWSDLLIAGIGGTALFAVILLHLMTAVIYRRWLISSCRPASARRVLPRLRTVLTLLVAATTLVLVDLMTGNRGWGLGLGFFLVVVGAINAIHAPILRHYFCQRLVDIDDFEPELLASLNEGHVSQHVLSAIRRWTEAEE